MYGIFSEPIRGEVVYRVIQGKDLDLRGGITVYAGRDRGGKKGGRLVETGGGVKRGIESR